MSSHNKKIGSNFEDNKSSRLYIYKAVTGIHAGAGDDIGFIDKPIQRETATGFPIIESSGVKGAIKEYYGGKFDENQNMYFGDETKAGALAFTDLKVLFFPVTCSQNIFAYVTCPYVLERFSEESEIFDLNSMEIDKLKGLRPIENKCYYFSNMNEEESIILAGYKFETIKKDFKFANSELEKIRERMIIVNDNVFSDFVKFQTEVITRNKINQKTGTAFKTGLFTEEYLPAETILYNFVKCFKDIKGDDAKILDFDRVFKGFFYIGGNKTLSKGMIKKIWGEKSICLQN